MENNKQYRSFNGTVDFNEQENTESRLVSGYAIRFNEESQNMGFYEIIDRGAVTQEVLDNSDIFAKLNHRDDAILARSRYGEGSLTLELREDGLYYMFDAPHTQWGDELLEHIKRGEISTSSFAFTVSNEKDSERWFKTEDGTIKREIYKIGRLYDVSPTFEAAYLTTSCNARNAEAIKEIQNKSEQINEKMDALKEKLNSL